MIQFSLLSTHKKKATPKQPLASKFGSSIPRLEDLGHLSLLPLDQFTLFEI
jgi:hypothetical protein